MFKDFDIRSAEEWASILSKSGMKEMPYIGGAAIRRLIVGSEDRLLNPQVVRQTNPLPVNPFPFTMSWPRPQISDSARITTPAEIRILRPASRASSRLRWFQVALR